MRYVEAHPQSRIEAKIFISGGGDRTIGPGVSGDVTLPLRTQATRCFRSAR